MGLERRDILRKQAGIDRAVYRARRGGQRVEAHAYYNTLIVNGSTDASAAVALAAAQRCGASIAVYSIPYGDKSNAINRFHHDLRVDAPCYFSVDAHVKISATALDALAICLAARPEVIAATGVAANGRTMRRHSEATLTHGGQLHGPLHAFRRDLSTAWSPGRSACR